MYAFSRLQRRYESVPNATDLRMCLQLEDKECHIHVLTAVVFTVRSNAVLCFLVNPKRYYHKFNFPDLLPYCIF